MLYPIIRNLISNKLLHILLTSTCMYNLSWGQKSMTDSLEYPIDSSNVLANFIHVDGGSFKMGDRFGDGNSDELPVHDVEVRDFMLNVFEVSFQEYDLFCDETGKTRVSDEGWGRGNRPVINVSWIDALNYCNWLSLRHGYERVYHILEHGAEVNWEANGYRLPTEAEWEYAAKGGKNGTLFRYSGSNYLSEVGWYGGNSGGKTHEKGTTSIPNALKLYDMSGNVWEWCWDFYDSKFYKHSPRFDPKGSKEGKNRIIKGGSWANSKDDCKNSFRFYWNPTFMNNNIGFRLAKNSK